MATLKFKLKRSYFSFPYFFLSVLFIVIPLIILLVYSFLDTTDIAKSGVRFVFFENYGEFFSKIETWKVLGRSFLIAFITTAACLSLAYPLAMILSNSKLNKSAILVLLFVLPMWINSILRTYAVKALYEVLGWQNVNSYIKVILAMVYDFFPFMLLPLYVVMVNMDKSYIEASEDLGASPVSTFLKVKLPLSLPGIISGILMVFMPTVSTFAISDIVAASPNMYLFGNLINNSLSSEPTYGLGSAYAFILLIIIAITMIVANKLSGGKVQPQAKGGGGVI